MNYHAKSGASSLKIDLSYAQFHFWRPFCFLAAIFFKRTVKIYLHAKSRACSSKIEQVRLIFVFNPAAVPAPVTKSPVELCASRQLKMYLTHCLKIIFIFFYML